MRDRCVFVHTRTYVSIYLYKLYENNTLCYNCFGNKLCLTVGGLFNELVKIYAKNHLDICQ